MTSFNQAAAPLREGLKTSVPRLTNPVSTGGVTQLWEQFKAHPIMFLTHPQTPLFISTSFACGILKGQDLRNEILLGETCLLPCVFEMEILCPVFSRNYPAAQFFEVQTSGRSFLPGGKSQGEGELELRQMQIFSVFFYRCSGRLAEQVT